MFGIAWLIYGSAFFLEGAMGTGGHFLHEQMPPVAQGSTWIGAGLTGIIASTLHRTRRSDTFGYLAAFLPPMVTSTSFLVGSVVYLLAGTWDLALLGGIGALLWGVFATIIGVCASWPEEPTLPRGDNE